MRYVIDKSILVDTNVIRYEFECFHVKKQYELQNRSILLTKELSKTNHFKNFNSQVKFHLGFQNQEFASSSKSPG